MDEEALFAQIAHRFHDSIPDAQSLLSVRLGSSPGRVPSVLGSFDVHTDHSLRIGFKARQIAPRALDAYSTPIQTFAEAEAMMWSTAEKQLKLEPASSTPPDRIWSASPRFEPAAKEKDEYRRHFIMLSESDSVSIESGHRCTLRLRCSRGATTLEQYYSLPQLRYLEVWARWVLQSHENQYAGLRRFLAALSTVPSLVLEGFPATRESLPEQVPFDNSDTIGKLLKGLHTTAPNQRADYLKRAHDGTREAYTSPDELMFAALNRLIS
jgi:hypothetical protein